MKIPYDECVVWTGGSIRAAKTTDRIDDQCCEASFPVVGTAMKKDDSDTAESRIIHNLASCGRSRNGSHAV